jgi:hypothetical protein
MGPRPRTNGSEFEQGTRGDPSPFGRCVIRIRIDQTMRVSGAEQHLSSGLVDLQLKTNLTQERSLKGWEFTPPQMCLTYFGTYDSI